MSDRPAPVPDAFPPLCPSFGVRDAASAMAWYRRVFDAREVMRLTAPDGTIIHGELDVAGCLVMLGEEDREQGIAAPPSLGGTPVYLHLYVSDVDAVVRRAVEEGAEVLIPVENQFYGDRAGRILDPFGHVWILATRKVEMSPKEMQARMDRMFGKE